MREKQVVLLLLRLWEQHSAKRELKKHIQAKKRWAKGFISIKNAFQVWRAQTRCYEQGRTWRSVNASSPRSLKTEAWRGHWTVANTKHAVTCWRLRGRGCKMPWPCVGQRGHSMTAKNWGNESIKKQTLSKILLSSYICQGSVNIIPRLFAYNME